MTSTSVMIVEDEVIVRRDLEERLRSLGFNVIAVASSCAEAVQRAKLSHPDVILMDIRLSGSEDGIEAARQINTHQPTPIVFLTAHADDSTLLRAGQTGPYGFLVKPANDAGLKSAIEIALQRFRLDRKLREEDHFLLALLESIGDAVVATDCELRILRLNPMAERILEVSLSQVQGQRLTEWLQLLDPNTNAPFPLQLEEILSAESTRVFTKPVLLRGREGTKLLVEGSCAPIRENQRDVLGLVLVLRDVSERLRMAELEEQVRQMAFIGQLAGGLSHDFNNLLTTILGYCELARTRGPDAASLSEYLDNIQQAGTRATEIARQLLAFSRKSFLKLQQLHINNLLQRIQVSQSFILGDGIDLQFLPDPTDPVILGDPEVLEKMILTLLLSIRDRMHQPGRVVLSTATLARLPATIWTEGDTTACSWVRIRCQDNGVYLPEESLDRLFVPYCNDPDRRRVGTALRLPSIHGNVRQHGGYIEVHSSTEQGTLFDIFLPRSELPGVHEPFAP